MSEIVILENKQGSKLFKDRFIHGGQTYLVAKQLSGFQVDKVMASYICNYTGDLNDE